MLVTITIYMRQKIITFIIALINFFYQCAYHQSRHPRRMCFALTLCCRSWRTRISRLRGCWRRLLATRRRCPPGSCCGIYCNWRSISSIRKRYPQNWKLAPRRLSRPNDDLFKLKLMRKYMTDCFPLSNPWKPSALYHFYRIMYIY